MTTDVFGTTEKVRIREIVKQLLRAFRWDLQQRADRLRPDAAIGDHAKAAQNGAQLGAVSAAADQVVVLTAKPPNCGSSRTHWGSASRRAKASSRWFGRCANRNSPTRSASSGLAHTCTHARASSSSDATSSWVSSWIVRDRSRSTSRYRLLTSTRFSPLPGVSGATCDPHVTS
ncbi:hypothetical protein [Streptomyces sp. NBC_01451]|uniref:hypothetical protein n=1 Tax=Streptomyces sp. NBC_01451 TaxID=2903872 RepID=UPI002E323250|nr:hypothetical protein [Streptomyces sp. NBC_01451]